MAHSGSTSSEFRLLREIRRTKTRGVYSSLKYSVALYSWYPQNKLGSGTFGNVVSAYDEKGRRQVAIKIFKGNSTESMLEAEHEAKMIKKCEHKNIICILDTFRCNKGPCIVLHKYPCSLENYIYSHTLSDEKIKQMMLQLSLAVQYLQKIKLIHRDIKLDNILLTNCYDIKLSDFGCAITSADGAVDYGDIGTPAYQAPECSKQKGYTFLVDNWSVGVCIANLVFDNEFDGSESKCLNWIHERDIDQTLHKILDGLLQKNPLKRMTIGEVITSEWITGKIDLDYIPMVDLTR